MDDKILKDAQYRKGLSIAYFNALNNAIALAVGSRKEGETDEQLLKRVEDIRDSFLEQHKEYYARVIAKVGTNYNPAETIKKLKTAKNLGELRGLWQSLSEDERQDAEIKRVTGELKAKHENS